MVEREELRADLLLYKQGFAASRERAQALIGAGLAYADGLLIQKPAQKLSCESQIEIRGEWCPYVSRGGFKLEHALKSFHVVPDGRIALDVGASTGGFTDVLLQNGAKLVYALDVGIGQLDQKIASDPRVVQMDKVNARALTPDMFSQQPDLAVMDVSFISILKILPALGNVLGPQGELISLVKPQFEAGIEQKGKKGIITNPAVHEKVLLNLANQAPLSGWKILSFDYSPILGTQGNLEFLAHLVPEHNNCSAPEPSQIRSLVREAHARLRRSKKFS